MLFRSTVDLTGGGKGTDFFRGIPGQEKQPPANAPGDRKRTEPAPPEVKKESPPTPPAQPERPAEAKKEVRRLQLPRAEAELRQLKVRDPDAGVRAAAAAALIRLSRERP